MQGLPFQEFSKDCAVKETVHIVRTNDDLIHFKMIQWFKWYSAKLHALFLHDKDMN